jgi:chromate transporter
MTAPPTLPVSPASTSPDDPPALAELFVAFAKISLAGFGGVLAWSRRMLVQEKKWMTADAFNELLALCQFLPGPNVVNLSAVFGARVRGLSGALVCFAGLMAPPVVLMMLAGALYTRYGALPQISGALAGLAAAAAGLLIATAVQMAQPLLRRRFGPEPVFAVFVFLAIGVFRLPLIPVLAVLIPASVALAWWVRR